MITIDKDSNPEVFLRIQALEDNPVSFGFMWYPDDYDQSFLAHISWKTISGREIIVNGET